MVEELIDALVKTTILAFSMYGVVKGFIQPGENLIIVLMIIISNRLER